MCNQQHPYYAELDEETQLYCVFNVKDSDAGIAFAYSSWASMEAAEADANQRNGK